MPFKYRALNALLISLVLAFLQVNPSFSVTSLGPETPEAGLDTTKKERVYQLDPDEVESLQSSDDQLYDTRKRWPRKREPLDFSVKEYLEFSFPELTIPTDASLVSVELRHEYRYTSKKVTGYLQGKYDIFSGETLLGSVAAGIPAKDDKDFTDIKELVELLDSVEDLFSLKIRFYLISTAKQGTDTQHDLASLSVVYNRRPNADNQTPVTDEDTPLAIILTASDPDDVPDYPITFSLVDSPENGVVELYPTGEVTYTPKKDFYGNDSFTFKATDALEAESDPATVNITVNPVNDPPTPPILLSPSDALETNSPDINFSWGESVDVDLDELVYSIQIDLSEFPCDWEDLLEDQEVSGLSYSMAGLTDGNYCWRVGVSDGIDLDHIWSESWIFVVDLPAAISSTISTEAPGDAPQNSITISWTTDKPADSRVIYDTVSHSVLGAAPNYGYAFSTATFNTPVLFHSVTIVGLSPNTTYYYRTVSAASPVTVSTEFSFTTAEVEEVEEDDTEKRQGSVPQVPSAIAVQESKDRVLGKELVETAEEPKLATVPDEASVDTSADPTAPRTVWIALLATLGVGVIYVVSRRRTR